MNQTGLNRFDYPLPIMDIDTDHITIETKDVYNGEIKIKNTGGGKLKGRVLSRCPGLTFSPQEFDSNSKTLKFTFNPKHAAIGTGQTLDGMVYISTNAGEKEIPVSVKITKMSIATSDGHTIANLKDFYEYSLKNPTQARRIFTDTEFYVLLLAIGYEYMEVYESLHKDSNRERAMDNFFILSGLKSRTTLSLSHRQVEYVQKPYENESIYGNITVTRSDIGFIDAPIIVSEGEAWLSVAEGKLSTADFSKTSEQRTAIINFKIRPRNIQKPYVRGLITIGGTDNTVEIIYRRTPKYIVRLNRDAYRHEDKGFIEVVNNTGGNMRVDVFCKESYIKFTARSFLVDTYGEIPFDVKLSAFMNAQLFFRKLPYMQAHIEIVTVVPGDMDRNSLPIIVGEWGR